MKMIERFVMGVKIQLEECRDCERCGAKGAIPLHGIAYFQPCDTCRNTPEYEAELKAKRADVDKNKRINDSIKAAKPAAIWEGKGRQVFTNHKGNIIANEPYKPRPLGRKDWGKL